MMCTALSSLDEEQDKNVYYITNEYFEEGLHVSLISFES